MSAMPQPSSEKAGACRARQDSGRWSVQRALLVIARKPATKVRFWHETDIETPRMNVRS
jgi:hypothetical protein